MKNQKVFQVTKKTSFTSLIKCYPSLKTADCSMIFQNLLKSEFVICIEHVNMGLETTLWHDSLHRE